MAQFRDEDAVSVQPRSDAYTGMLVISLLAMVTGCVFLYLDLSQYPDKPPAPPAPIKVEIPAK